MTYQANVPQPNDLISNSQNDILNNFQAIGTTYPTDHVNFNAPGTGFHQKVTFNAPLVTDPNLASPKATAYTKASSAANSDLYYQYGALASDVVQLTGGGITAAAYVRFAGATGVPDVLYNATSTRLGIGIYQITFTRPFFNANYLPLLSANGSGFNGLNFTHWNFVSNSTFVFEVTETTLVGPHVDPAQVTCAFFGVLA
jgi:hypothetical protein